MYDYGEACPISKASSILGERWTLQIIREMMLGSTRFNEFKRYLPKISPTLLNARLRSLEDAGIIARKRVPEHKGFEYLLTPAGKALRPMMMELGKWGMAWAFTELLDDELNAAVILRDIAFKLPLDELPAGDSVIQFTLTDVKESPVRYVLVKHGGAEYCDENPGYEVDLYIHTSERTLTELWYGKTTFKAACADNAVKVAGSNLYTKNISRWFPVSEFTS